MININKILFIFSCLFVSVCQAEKFITFDSVALDTAMNEITRVGSDSPYKSVEEAGDAFYDAFYAAKKNNTVDIDKVADKCANEIIKSGRVCNNFLVSYNTHLNKANYCLKANKEKITPTDSASGRENKKEYTFQECTSVVSAEKFHHNDGTTSYQGYHGDSYLGKCVDWVNDAKQCQSYLIGYYKDKLDNSKLSKSDKKYYECLLEKVQTGNMDFPLSKMEQSCKS